MYIFDASKRVSVDKLMFGGSSIAGYKTPVSTEDAHDAIKSCIEHGITMYDTAPFYGNGLSEIYFGQVLSTIEDITIDTKCGWNIIDTPHNVNTNKWWFGTHTIEYSEAIRAFNKQLIKDGLNDSFKRLNNHPIRALRLHMVNKNDIGQTKEAIDAMCELRNEKIIQEISLGVDGVSAYHFINAYTNTFDSALIASSFNILDNRGQGGIEACIHNSIEIDLASPFDGGILFNLHFNDNKKRDRYNKWLAIANKFNISVQSIALLYCYAVKNVRSVCFGARNRKQVNDVVSWCKEIENLSDEMVKNVWNEAIAINLVSKNNIII